jgi:hypothetical protein
MRSLSFSYSLLGALVLASGFAVACSSSASPGSDSSLVTHPGESGSSSGGGSGSSGGGSSGGGAGNASSSGSGSGGTSGSGSGSSGGSGGSSSGSSSGGPTTTISADTTWADGTKITASTTIAKGVTVTIANGATITVSPSVAITVDGTLTATSATAHASLTGAGWAGLVIASGGTLKANSLDIEGATTALDVTGTAEYDDGAISNSTAFKVETGGTLTTKNASVTTPIGSSISNGTFNASYLDYNSGGVGGIAVESGTATITDSTFHGPNNQPPDMIVSTGTGSLTMLYDEIYGCHCAYHFDDITSFDLENVYIHDVSYGFMMYGSVTTGGTRIVKSSNFDTMADAAISESGTNGPITVEGCYMDSSSKLQLTDQEITIASPATTANANVGPRAQ